MGAITAAVAAGVAVAGASAIDKRQQQKAADRAAKIQARGVEAAQEESRAATERAIPILEQGFADARQTLDPIAALAQPTMQEQLALLNLQGPEAFQSALGRVSDPLVAEQERAFRRNVGALGATGGNALAQLAEMTRARSEANISNRLAQLGSVGSQGINALTQQAQLQAGGGQAVGGTIVGQRPELVQLAQNLGIAQSGGQLFRAGQAPISESLSAGINAAASVYGMGGGGGFGGFGQMAGSSGFGGSMGGGAGAGMSPPPARPRF